MQQKYLIEDWSGDKKYFTIIPNYIANNSSANDQALYFQLKRLAGDTGKMCYPSINYLQKQLGVRKKAIKTSLDYLIKHEWIEALGKRQVMTAGGRQWVNAYRIKDIWRLNTEYYEGGNESTPLKKDKGVTKDTKGVTKVTKGVTVVACKEERKKNVRRMSSFKKPHYKGEEMRFSKGRWWVLPNDGGEWLEFAGKEEDITYN
jgi:hypothetical protein